MAITGGDTRIFNSSLTSNSATALEELGAIRTEYDSTNGQKVYMYVQADAAIAVGDVVTWNGTGGFSVGPVTTAGNLALHPIVGVGLGTITATYYGWIQVRGFNSAVKCHSKYNQTAYNRGFLLSGFFRGKPDGDSYETGLSGTPVDNGFIPFASGASACTTVSGYISAM